MIPRAAYHKLVHDEVELVGLDAMPGRVAGTGIVSYPRHSHDHARRSRRPCRGTVPDLSAHTAGLGSPLFAGFAHDTHGVEMEDGEYYVYCIKEGV